MSTITLQNDIGSTTLTGNILCIPTSDEACTTSTLGYLQEAVSVSLSVSLRDYKEEVSRGLLTIHRSEESRWSVHLTCIDLDCNFYFGSRWTLEDLSGLVKGSELLELEAWEPNY